MKLKHSFVSPTRMLYPSQSAMQSGTELRGLHSIQYKAVTKQMEVDFDTHLKSIQYKLKSFRSKSELEEIFQWKSFNLRIAYDSYRSKECQSKSVLCLEVS